MVPSFQGLYLKNVLQIVFSLSVLNTVLNTTRKELMEQANNQQG